MPFHFPTTILTHNHSITDHSKNL